MPNIRQRLRQKQTTIITSDARCPKHKEALMDSKAATSFNMEVTLPCGGADPDPAGANMTVTGTVKPNTGITFQVWYTDANGTNTNLDPTTLAITGASSPYHWSITFVAPAAGDYIFSLEGTFAPPGAPGSTNILLSAPFTTA